MLIPSVIGATITSYLKVELGSTVTMLVGASGFPLALAIVTLGQRKLRAYKVEDEEWAMFYARPLQINLAKCVKTNSEGMRKDYRRNAIKNAEGLLSCIQKGGK